MKSRGLPHSAVLLHDGRVLPVGARARGWDTVAPTTRPAEVYDPATGEWTWTESMGEQHSFMAMAVLPDGTVLVAGGTGSQRRPVNIAETWDPTSGTWSPAEPMRKARDKMPTIMVDDDRVMVAGGTGDMFGMRASAEIYDPAAGTWSMAGSMFDARYRHTAMVLSDGSVLMPGGQGEEILAKVEVYSP